MSIINEQVNEYMDYVASRQESTEALSDEMWVMIFCEHHVDWQCCSVDNSPVFANQFES